jgi:hypothetical protein
MITAEPTSRLPESRADTITAYEYEKWRHWPVNWSAIAVGTLAAISILLVLSLIALAVGGHLLRPEARVVDLKKLAIASTVYSVCGAFFAFVAGGWIAGKVAGILRSEPAMLHGAIVWLTTIPVLAVLVGVGAGSYAGGWLTTSGDVLAQKMPFERPDGLGTNATAEERASYTTAMSEYRENVAKWEEETPKAVRNSALCAITAVLLGLMGSVIGGWMASGEPMTLTYHRHRAEFPQSNYSPA